MIRIIKYENHPNKIQECYNCCCVFSYKDKDTEDRAIHNLYNLLCNAIDCLQCKVELILGIPKTQ